jgi:hypothetical protein
MGKKIIDITPAPAVSVKRKGSPPMHGFPVIRTQCCILLLHRLTTTTVSSVTMRTGSSWAFTLTKQNGTMK